MMAVLWADIERDLANARRCFEMGIEGFEAVKASGSDKERYFRRAAFMHAMLAGYTCSESAMRRLVGLLGEEMPTAATSGTRG